MFKNYADDITPVPGSYWSNLSNNERVNVIDQIKSNMDTFKDISITRVLENGNVFITLNNTIRAAERGKLLLDFEEELKKKLDQGLSVWSEPLGDRNSLRKLRGIEIKT